MEQNAYLNFLEKEAKQKKKDILRCIYGKATQAET